eukprot:2367892-Rhodomonas_salina.1
MCETSVGDTVEAITETAVSEDSFAGPGKRRRAFGLRSSARWYLDFGLLALGHEPELDQVCRHLLVVLETMERMLVCWAQGKEQFVWSRNRHN